MAKKATKTNLFSKIKKSLSADPKFTIFIAIVIVTALFFRFYNYHNRIFIESDNTRDAQVAQYAADHLKIPLIGQYSSAGPFFYGPLWYWALEVFSFFPFGPFTQWYFTAFLSLIFIYLIFLVGQEIANKWLGGLAALLAAVAPRQIVNALTIWNPSIIPLISLLLIYLLIKLSKSKRDLYAFLLGLTLGSGLTIHFQSILLLPIGLMAVFISKFDIKKIILIGFGTFLPFIPLLIFDAHHNWVDFKNIYDYLMIGQYRIWVPNRWLTYALDYWPKTWSEIVGGNLYVTYFTIGLIGLMLFVHLKKIKLNRLIYILVLTFVIEVVMYRYYRGERFVYYSFWAQPYIILFSAWGIWKMFRYSFRWSVILLLLILGFTCYSALGYMSIPKLSYSRFKPIINEIYTKYPNQKFSIYGCLGSGGVVAHPLAYLLYKDNRNDVNGVKIGVCEIDGLPPMYWREIPLSDIGGQHPGWFEKNTQHVFTDTVEWWIKNSPK